MLSEVRKEVYKKDVSLNKIPQIWEEMLWRGNLRFWMLYSR